MTSSPGSIALSPEELAFRDAVARRRNFAIISHPDAGKTTLTEKLLLEKQPDWSSALAFTDIADAVLAFAVSDTEVQARFAEAQQQGRGLRYLAQLDRDGTARVRLVTPDATHASLHSQLTDNLIQFRTRRYAANPLVVQGPGAGRDVTAAGVFGDILSIAQTLGARA